MEPFPDPRPAATETGGSTDEQSTLSDNEMMSLAANLPTVNKPDVGGDRSQVDNDREDRAD